jgi:gliding motility-associated-like protein
MPNAFTPNADGNNDFFRPVTQPEKIRSFTMYIYDRWGRQIYATKDLGAGWNGTIDGRFGFAQRDNVAPMGVYTYIINYGNLSGETRRKTGVVTLVR